MLIEFAVGAFILPIPTIVVAVTFGVVAHTFLHIITAAAMELILSPAGRAMSYATLIPPSFAPISASAVSITKGWYNSQL